MTKKYNHLFEVGLKAIIIRDGKCLIVKRHPDDTFGGEWEIPGGAMDSAEQPERALLREIQEETGLEVTIGMPLRVWTIPGEDGQCVGITFLAECRTQQEVILSPEHTEYQWVTLDELQEMDVPQWLRIESRLGYESFGLGTTKTSVK